MSAIPPGLIKLAWSSRKTKIFNTLELERHFNAKRGIGFSYLKPIPLFVTGIYWIEAKDLLRSFLITSPSMAAGPKVRLYTVFVSPDTVSITKAPIAPP